MNYHSIVTFFLLIFLTDADKLKIHGDSSTGVLLHEWPFESVGRECKIFLGPNNYSYAQIALTLKRTERSRLFSIFSPKNMLKIVFGHGSENKFKEMIKKCKKYGVGIIADISIDRGGHSSVNFSDPSISESLREALVWLLDEGVVGFRFEKSKTGFIKPIVDLEKHGVKEQPLIIHAGIPSEAIFGYSNNKLLYPVYAEVLSNTLKKKFLRSLKDLIRFVNDEHLALSGSKAVVFVDQPDKQRESPIDNINFRHLKLLKLATTFMLAWPYGMPLIMSSYFWPVSIVRNRDINRVMTPLDAWKEIKNKSISFKTDAEPSCNAPWICEHRFTEISSMVKFRKVVDNEPVENWWSFNDNAIAFDRGSKGFFAMVNGNFNLTNVKITTNLPNGVYCNILSYTSARKPCKDRYTVCNGEIRITIDGKSNVPIIALHSQAMVNNSSLDCASQTVLINKSANKSVSNNETGILISPINYNGFKFNITTRLSVDSPPNPVEITINMESKPSEKLSQVPWLTTILIILSMCMLLIVVLLITLMTAVYRNYFKYYLWNGEPRTELK